MTKIEEALEKSIPEKGNCKICSNRYEDTCDITEEKIGSGETYCDLKPSNLNYE